MKKILIISPHFPPSNLAAVHRSRLFAQHLPSFGWEPIILTVDEKYYEEPPDHQLKKLLPPGLQVEKVKAFKVTRPRLIGDIGLRAFFQLYKRAKQLIETQKIDFLYIPIPSFYCALLGRWLHYSTNIQYGIDYIDPWVHNFPGSNKTFSRHWFSKKLARMLETIAVKNAALITGVASGYYEGMTERNPHLKQQAVFGGMPYGGEKADHQKISGFDLQPYLFSRKSNTLQLVYAGAMLPKAYQPLEAIFKAVHQQPEIFSNIEFHFIGTGSRVNDETSYTIKPLAIKYNLWQTVVFEYARRIPYLDVLLHLNIADAIFILGSTEPHYTPSKTYQGILSGKPIVAVLHAKSTAVEVIKESGAGTVLSFDGENDLAMIENNFVRFMLDFQIFMGGYNPSDIKIALFDQYSAKNITGQLAALLNRAIAYHP